MIDRPEFNLNHQALAGQVVNGKSGVDPNLYEGSGGPVPGTLWPGRRGQQRRYPVDPDMPRAAARVTLGPGPLWPGEPEHPRRRLREHGGSWRGAVFTGPPGEPTEALARCSRASVCR